MHDPDDRRFLETTWRRQRDAAEEEDLRRRLAEHPELEPDRDMEIALTEALARMANVEVPSNFTARVLSRTEAPANAHSHPHAPWWTWLWRPFIRRTAYALVLAGIAWFGFHQHQVDSRAQLARNIAAVSGVAAEPGAELIQDFEAIRRLNQMPGPDEQLLALLK